MMEGRRCIRIDGDNEIVGECPLAEEVPLSISLNGKQYITAMMSPGMKREFVIGHLVSERVVKDLSEIESLEIEGNTAKAIITNPIRALTSRKPIIRGCGGSSSFLDEAKLPKITSDLRVDCGGIMESMKAISVSEVHQATGGVHSVGLFGSWGEICICEDIGRHNALDKALGFGIINKIRLEEVFAVSTGRISSDMALKCSSAGIPLLASRGATTSLAITIAEKTGLTLMGFVRGKRVNIYTNSWRVIGSALGSQAVSQPV